MYLSMYLSICIYLYVSIYMYLYLYVSISMYLSIWMHILKVDDDLRVEANEFDGKVVYGQKKKAPGSG